MLHTASAWTLIPGAIASAGWAVLAEPTAGASCAVGVLVVVAIFASGMWALRLVLRKAAYLAQAGAFAIFFLQMYVGLVLAATGRTAAWIDPFALAAGAIGATLVWQAGLVAGFATARRPVYSPVDNGVPGAGWPATDAPDRQEGGRR